ncbi:pyridoxamine 5'-phosphate oxidase family protein [Alloscardovia venturai]|uniref:Pyridoxamine 5'-phosphate oxidase family protein n=1 Tax=Alloscardovia venturai TaxID=1769421 RepID=A0ABW2YAU2_9BIFI
MMNSQDYDNAVEYWRQHDKNAHKAGLDEVKKFIDDFLSKHNTCVLSTASGDDVHATVVEYTFMNGSLYILSEGGEKFGYLKKNNHVSAAVYDSYTPGKLGAVVIDATAEVDKDINDDYKRLLEIKKIPLETIKSLNHAMYLIKLVPRTARVISSTWREKGFDSREAYVYER